MWRKNYDFFDIFEKSKENFKIEKQEIFEIKQDKSKENLKIDKQDIFEIKQDKSNFSTDGQLSLESNEIKLLKEQLAQLKKQIILQKN